MAFNDPEETKEETKITTELSSILKQERQNRKELHEKIENAKIENDFDIINSEATNNLKDFNISSKSTESDKNKGVKSYLNTMYNAAAKIVKPITHRFQKSSKNSKKSKQNSI